MFAKNILILFFLVLSFYFSHSIEESTKSNHFSVKPISNNQKFLSKTSNTPENEEVEEDSSSSNSKYSKYTIPVFGAILFVFSLILLWKNESNYVITCHRLKTELLECAAIEPDVISTEHNGHLIYLQGITKCEEFLKDDVFLKVIAFNSFKIIRTVEMFQWKEEKHFHSYCCCTSLTVEVSQINIIILMKKFGQRRKILV